MRLVTVSLIVLVFMGCKVYHAPQKSYVGLTKQEFIVDFGLPSETGSDGGSGEVLVYKTPRYNPSTDVNYTVITNVFVDLNKVITRISHRNEVNYPTQVRQAPQQRPAYTPIYTP